MDLTGPRTLKQKARAFMRWRKRWIHNGFRLNHRSINGLSLGQKKHIALAMKLTPPPKRNHGWSHRYCGGKPITASHSARPVPNRPQASGDINRRLNQFGRDSHVPNNHPCRRHFHFFGGRPRFFGGFAFSPFAVLCCGGVASMRFSMASRRAMVSSSGY